MKLMSILAASCFALALPASGQTLRANIPFAFTSGESNVPAGEYIVTVDIPGHRLMISDGDRLSLASLFMTTVHAAAPRDRAELVFHKYGEDYFLRQIRTSESDVTMPVVKAETFAKRAATGNRGPKMALVRISIQ